MAPSLAAGPPGRSGGPPALPPAGPRVPPVAWPPPPVGAPGRRRAAPVPCLPVTPRPLHLAALAALAPALLALAAWTPAAPAALPFSLVAERRQLEGRVAAQLDAGDYRYLEVVDAAGATAWVVTLAGPALPEGSRVTVRSFGRAPAFRSARLDRDFAPLLFAAVQPAVP